MRVAETTFTSSRMQLPMRTKTHPPRIRRADVSGRLVRNRLQFPLFQSLTPRNPSRKTPMPSSRWMTPSIRNLRRIASILKFAPALALSKPFSTLPAGLRSFPVPRPTGVSRLIPRERCSCRADDPFWVYVKNFLRLGA